MRREVNYGDKSNRAFDATSVWQTTGEPSMLENPLTKNQGENFSVKVRLIRIESGEDISKRASGIFPLKSPAAGAGPTRALHCKQITP